MTTQTGLTLEEFLALPDIDERRLELIDGEVCERASPNWGHGRLAAIIYSLLDQYGYASVEPRAVISPAGNRGPNSPIPDVAYYRMNPPADGEWMTHPPDIAVEIISPGQTRPEMRSKVDIYLAFGVTSVWLVDPERKTIEVYESAARRVLGGSDVLSSPAAPGLAVTVDELSGMLRKKK